MKFEATQFGSLAQRPEREDRYRALNTPVPHSPCALHPETWHVLGLCSSHPAVLQQQLPWGLCSLPQAPAPPQAHPSMARQGAGPTHLSRTAWMASAALS